MGIKFKDVLPTEELMAFRVELLELMSKYAGDLTAFEMLALGSYVVGQMLAAQDPRALTTDQYMQLIMDNLFRGNHDAVANLMKPEGSA